MATDPLPADSSSGTGAVARSAPRAMPAPSGPIGHPQGTVFDIDGGRIDVAVIAA
jgi:hypothetical protein